MKRILLATGLALGLTSVAQAQQIGIPVCDVFLTKYEACLSKVPAAAKPQLEASMKEWRASWKQLAENPQTKPTLESLCTQMAEQMKASMNSAYSCGF